ncbi:MAG: hypothetical protein Q4A32_08025, partial [Lachnospiraceae bacterium]|nr:hypothetical protein [Lachnospiraceae bacterium]
MKKKWKKVSAFFLVLAMVLNLSGIVVLAADPEEPRVEVGEAFAEDPEGEDTPEAIEEIIPEEVSSEAEAGSEEQLEQKDVSEGLSVDVDSVLAEQPEENSLSEDPVGDAVPFLSEQPEEESFAAGEIPVGDMSGIYVGDPASGSSSPYLPEFSYYNYSMTQQIYLADEIECSGTISSLTFYKMKGVGVGRTRTVEFYLRHTDKESFDEKTDWVPMTADDLVYEGNLVIPAGNGRENGRVTVQLDKPFEYNGTDNLLLCCYDKTGTYVG